MKYKNYTSFLVFVLYFSVIGSDVMNDIIVAISTALGKGAISI